MRKKPLQKMWTLKQVAKNLGVTYTWVWMNVKRGVLQTIRLSDRTHGVPDDELKRFERTRRPRGRPPKPLPAGQGGEIRRSPRKSVSGYYHRLSSSTKSTLKRIRHYRLARVGLLPVREEFPEGSEVDSSWDAAVRQRLGDIEVLRPLGITDYRDQALILKLRGRSIPHNLLDRALMSYVLLLPEFVNCVKDVTLKEAAQKFARRPWSGYPGTKSMPLEERAHAIEALLRMFLGSVTQEEVLLAFRAVGMDTKLLPELSELLPGGQRLPDGSLPQNFLATSQKIVDLVSSCVTTRDDGKRVVMPSWTHEEMDQAWDLARLILSKIPDHVRRDPKLSVRDHIANIAFTVVRCLIVIRESGGKVSDIGAAAGAWLGMALTCTADASREMKEIIHQIIEVMSRPPKSQADLFRRLK